MRSYLILRERAARWNADAEIQGLLHEFGTAPSAAWSLAGYTPAARESLMREAFDRRALASRGLAYERLDQLTMELLLGVR
jgi:xylose isomerase